MSIIATSSEKSEDKMNIMFCGDSHAEDSILITTLSLLKHINSPTLLHLTMHAEDTQLLISKHLD